MKYHRLAVLLTITFSGFAYAQQPDQTAAVQSKIAAMAERNIKGYIEYMDPIVTLTDAQKEAVRQEITSNLKARVELEAKHGAELKAAVDSFHAALETKDADAIQQAQLGLAKDNAPFQELDQKHVEKLEGLLTAGQKEKLKDYRFAQEIKEAAKPVELTAAQIKAVKATIKDPDDMDPEKDVLKEAVENVMTRGQKATLITRQATFMVKFWAKHVKFTEEQKAKADALGEQLSKDVNLKLQDVHNRICKGLMDLLTPEQKKIAEEHMLENYEIVEDEDAPAPH